MEVEQGAQVRRKTMVRRPGEGEKKEQGHMSSAGALEASYLPPFSGAWIPLPLLCSPKM